MTVPFVRDFRAPRGSLFHSAGDGAGGASARSEP
jgi:hypothetical protein